MSRSQIESFCTVMSFLMALTATSVQAQWIEQAAGFPTAGVYINAIDAVDVNVAWAVAGRIPPAPDARFTRTTDGGALWTVGTITTDPGFGVVDISALDAETAWTGLDSFSGGARVYKTTDGGATWVWQQSAFASPTSFVNTIHFYDADHGVATGDPQGGYFEICTTTDGGTSWARVPQTNIPPPLVDEWCYMATAAYWDDIVWFATSQGRVLKSTNRGLDWTVSDMGIGPVYDIGGISFKDANHGLVTAHYAGGQRWIVRTSDGGDTWETLASPAVPGEILGVQAVPGDATHPEIYVVTSYGTFGAGGPGSAMSYDDGDTWILIDTLPHGPADFVAWDHGWSGGRSSGAGLGGMWLWMGPLALSDPSAAPPAESRLAQNVPNPCRATTTIAFWATGTDRVSLKVYDVRGGKVATLVARELPRGRHVAQWDASDLPSGVYFYRLEQGHAVETRKLLRVD